MRLSKRQLAILSLILANIIWGASFPIYKWALKDVPPFTFVYLRFFLGALAILPFTYKNLKVNAEDVGKLIILSICGITLAISFLFLGLQLAPSINAPIIFSSSPIILILFALTYLREKPRKKIIIGTWISFLGVLLIVLRPILEKGLNLAVLGNLFFILANFADVAYTILLERMMKKDYSPLTIVFWSSIIGCIPLLPLVFIEQVHKSIFIGLDLQGIIGILFGFLLSTAFAHSINAYGAKYIKTSEIGIFAYVDPVATILVAIPLLGESVTFYYLLGTIFVFAGIFIAEGRIHYHPFHLLSEKPN